MSVRKNLDDFMSIVCFKAAIKGMEDILGEEGTAAALIAAGRRRGADVAASAGLTGKNPDATALAAALDKELGVNGTHLCCIAGVSDTPEGGYLVKAKDTVCMAGEAPGSTRHCTYTMGAVMGCIEAATGKKLTGKHVKTILEGQDTDDFLFTPMA